MIGPEAGAWQWIVLGATAVVIVTATVFDLRQGRIPNSLTYPAALFGVLAHVMAVSPWAAGLKDSMLGLLLGFGILFLAYMFGGIGGGDVKLAGCLGALVGLEVTALGLLYMGLLGGLMALGIMIWKGKLFASLKRMGRFFFTALIPFLETEMPDEENSDPFPLGVAISGGFAWAIAEHFTGAQLF